MFFAKTKLEYHITNTWNDGFVPPNGRRTSTSTYTVVVLQLGRGRDASLLSVRVEERPKYRECGVRGEAGRRCRQESVVVHGRHPPTSCASPPGQHPCPTHHLAHPAATTRREVGGGMAWRWRRRADRSLSHPRVPGRACRRSWPPAPLRVPGCLPAGHIRVMQPVTVQQKHHPLPRHHRHELKARIFSSCSSDLSTARG
jgi:hypothetical protein